ncbi:MAG TPA: DUF2306 domain-containing protein [Pyrinomonadaceae bacterium]|jgi:uncharacterized membrane protein|nr:DUF2306 domain-containing protein [Pyrinomonadaceae bacterium]
MSFRAKHVFFAAFGLLTLFVFYTYEVPFTDPNSPAWQRIEPVKWLMALHGPAGALALLLAPFQFSTRLRQRHRRLHRILGRLYVVGVAIAAPIAIPIAVVLGPGALVPAATIQTMGWLLTTAVGLYCIRAGNVRQHEEWMIRSYPFAMVFVFARAILAIPSVRALGEDAFIAVVWSCEALACFVPSVIIALRSVNTRKTTPARAPLGVKTARATV